MPAEPSRALIEPVALAPVLSEIKRAIAEAKDPVQLKSLRDRAEALHKYFQSAALGLEMQNRAAELRLRAQRRIGQILADLHLHGGDRRSRYHSNTLKLADLGITKLQSSRWRKEAQVPDEVFERYIRWGTEQREEITSRGLMRAGSKDSGNGKTDKKKGIKPVIARHREVADCLAEIAEHAQLLNRILAPVYEGDGVALPKSERRHLQHLLAEITRLAHETLATPSE